MTALARLIVRHRLLVIGTWVALTAVGIFSAGKVSSRWLEEFSIPGYSAFEANQRTLKTLGTGEAPPHVVVFHGTGDATKNAAIGREIDRVAKRFPQFRVSSYFSTHDRAYVSRDGRTTFALFYAPGQQGFNADTRIGELRRAFQSAAPPGVGIHVTGRDALYDAQGESNGPSVLTEALIGGVGALVILLFVFGTLPAIAMPLLIAFCSILNTFTLILLLTYVTSVSIIVQFLVALVGLGVAIDYSLLMIFRFREELARTEDVPAAVGETMKHAGRSVIVSGSTVAIGLLSLVVLPIPVIRSIGIGGMLIPAVSVVASITLLPALFSLLGHRINRLRVMPRRIVEATDAEAGFWGRWAGLVMRRPLLMGGIGTAIVAVLIYFGLQLNPSEAQAKDIATKGDAVAGLATLKAAGISPGVLKPFIVLVENNRSPQAFDTVAARLDHTPGITGAAAPKAWRKETTGLVEAFPSDDGAAKPVRKTISNLQDKVLPAVQRELGGGTRLTLGGVAAEDRDFVHAVYGNFPYMLAFVVLLTFLLLMRAFRSVLLPLKAVILNLVSLGAALGIIVFIFQQGHGAEAIWGVHATGAIISWIPLMIFAFLYGLSMDYEVFMVTRIREEYDVTGDTQSAVQHGLARTGKLVTSAALVLMFAFFVLSTGPGVDIKQFGIGLAAGIILDATVIRALLVPAIMRLMGRWNWWLPKPIERVLLVRRPAAPPGGA